MFYFTSDFFIFLAKAAKVLKIPFIASGGVGDGKQLIAALSLGAIGVNMGTRFGVTKENDKWKTNVKNWSKFVWSKKMQLNNAFWPSVCVSD